MTFFITKRNNPASLYVNYVIEVCTAPIEERTNKR